MAKSLEENINELKLLLDSNNNVIDDKLKLECLMIYKETMTDIDLCDLQSFGKRFIDLSCETNSSLFENVRYLCDTINQDINVFYTLCLLEKHKNEEENLLNIVKELNSLHEQGKIDFDAAAKFISEQFDIPIGRIMNLLFLC